VRGVGKACAMGAADAAAMCVGGAIGGLRGPIGFALGAAAGWYIVQSHWDKLPMLPTPPAPY